MPTGHGHARPRGRKSHPLIAVDAVSGFTLGLVDLIYLDRREAERAPHKERSFADKESRRWLDGAQSARQPPPGGLFGREWRATQSSSARFGQVAISRPKNGKGRETLPESLELNLVEAREIDPPEGEAPDRRLLSPALDHRAALPHDQDQGLRHRIVAPAGGRAAGKARRRDDRRRRHGHAAGGRARRTAAPPARAAPSTPTISRSSNAFA